MNARMVYLGLDVHKETIAVALAHAEPPAPVESLGQILNRPEAVRRLIHGLQPRYRLSACYEAGPCGYTVYRQLRGLGVDCSVVAPSLVPIRPGDRVKTDRRDAVKLARLLRSGELTPVWVPDPPHEALRNLTRLRAIAPRPHAGAAPAQQVLAALGPRASIRHASVESTPPGVGGPPDLGSAARRLGAR